MTLAIKNLQLKLGNKQILQNINFALQSHEICLLMGENGSGKTSLLKSLSILSSQISGDIIYNQTPFGALSRLEISRLITFVSPNLQIPFNYTVQEVVEMGAYRSQNCPLHALDEVNALNLKLSYFNTLSSGEKQRVLFARALASGAPCLLFDEPTAFLDLKQEIFFWKLLEKQKEKGKICLLSTHRFDFSLKYATRCLVLKQGHLVYNGTPEGFDPSFI